MEVNQEKMLAKVRELNIENMAHQKQLEALQALFESDLLRSNSRLAEVHRSQMHTVLDHILDNKAACVTIALLLANG